MATIDDHTVIYSKPDDVPLVDTTTELIRSRLMSSYDEMKDVVDHIRSVGDPIGIIRGIDNLYFSKVHIYAASLPASRAAEDTTRYKLDVPNPTDRIPLGNLTFDPNQPGIIPANHKQVSLAINDFGWNYNLEIPTLNDINQNPTNSYLPMTIFHELLHSSKIIDDVARIRFNEAVSRYSDPTSGLIAKIKELTGESDEKVSENLYLAIEHDLIYYLVKEFARVAESLDPIKFAGAFEAELIFDNNQVFSELANSFGSSVLTPTEAEQLSNLFDLDYYGESGVRALETECFLAGTMIDMADGSQKPIEDIRPEDQVMAFDEDGKKVAGRVTRTMTNESKIILDFHGTFVTPGHVYYCAGGKFGGGFALRWDPFLDRWKLDFSSFIALAGWLRHRCFVLQSGLRNRLRCEDEPHCSLYASSPTFRGHLQALGTSEHSSIRPGIYR